MTRDDIIQMHLKELKKLAVLVAAQERDSIIADIELIASMVDHKISQEILHAVMDAIRERAKNDNQKIH